MRRECRERFPWAPQVSDPDMHHGTCVTHVPWCMPGLLTSGFLWSWWQGKRSRHSRRMRNPRFHVSGKRPMHTHTPLQLCYMRVMAFQITDDSNIYSTRFCGVNIKENIKTRIYDPLWGEYTNGMPLTKAQQCGNCRVMTSSCTHIHTHIHIHLTDWLADYP